ncbi:hypothetical protein [Streptomyces sp. NBC_00094]|uniref:hypothetical protein n=1 Tax=Streptomyces sp. NBC_00094 TaxID=2903620 RepID=UPI00225BB331|nr:hypothetical protein [Streptomyces sp. NBC_00094]MCX5392788.1 hypothetical protein [Streptomyces sp. NBC_00094]
MRAVQLRRVTSRRRTAGLGALVAAVALALLPLPRDTVAVAAETENSAMTKRGTKGPYDDFSGLEVTVHQTKNLRAQGLKVTWKGGKPTQGTATDYLQIMQCWGDDPAGPKREQCQFGSAATGTGNYGTHITRRELVVGTDPLETEYDEVIPDPEYPGQTTSPFIPFTPVSGPPTAKSVDWTYFGPNDTNEEFFLRTQSDGTGEAAVNLQSTREAPHLGCGDPVGAGGNVRGRSCWLVVVPRGSHEPDGSAGSNHRPHTSPLSATNWNQRLVFPLDFLPVREACPTDKAERRMTGSELVTDAITSWQSALCAEGTTRFTFTQRGEDLARGSLLDPTSTSPGLAFTVEPVEGGEKAGFVHAPVAVNALAVGLYWEADKIGLVKDLKLSARLLAKLLTYSYPYDIRSLSNTAPAPEHVKNNPQSIVRDPEFLKLNPDFAEFQQSVMSYPGGILLSAERSDTTRVVWNYLRGDKDARAFLEGNPDPWGMRINPYFKDLGLATGGSDEFPKADPTETELEALGHRIRYGITERSPYAIDMHDAARWVRRGTNNAKDQAVTDHLTGGLKLVGVDVSPGSRRAYGITDAASASRYQLQVAALPNADGAYVRPTTSSLLKAVEQFGDSAVPGVLAPDPARAESGAYPLTVVTYAVASTGLPADARKDYARVMRYAAGAGQEQGTAPGELPFGYAPMPAKLKLQAEAAAGRLERGVPAGPGTTAGGAGAASGSGADAGAGSGSGGTTGSSGAGLGSGSGGTGGASGSATGSGSGGGSAAGGTTGGSTASPSSTPPSSAAPPPASGGGGNGSGGPPGEKLADTGSTPSQVLGVIRWVLLAVLLVGGIAGLAGPAVLGFAGRRRIPLDSPRTGIRHLKSD